MEQGYKVRMTEQAKEHLREIAYYITVHLQAPEAAIRTSSNLQKAIALLTYFPQRVILTEDEPWHSSGIRRLVVNNYLIYFRVDDAEKIVYILSVVYSRRNQQAVLEELDAETARGKD